LGLPQWGAFLSPGKEIPGPASGSDSAGFGAAALSTVSISLVAKHFVQGRGRAFGIYNAIKGAGYVIAPAVGGFIVHAASFAMIFGVSGGIGLVTLWLSLLLPQDRTPGEPLEDDEEELTPAQFFSIFKEARLLPVYGVIFINMFLVGILFGFLPVYLHAIGYTAVKTGSIHGCAVRKHSQYCNSQLLVRAANGGASG
jgi:MFS family permease